MKSNGISSFAIADITEYIESGCEVLVPTKNINLNSWSGIGHIVSYDYGYSFMLSNGTNGGETSKSIQDAYALQAKIVLTIYSLSLIFSVIAFVGAASPIVSAFLFAETLPKGFILTSLWFLASEIMLFENYDSFKDLLNDESTPSQGALKLTTTGGIMKYVTKLMMKKL